jgi:hypothetical protein
MTAGAFAKIAPNTEASKSLMQRQCAISNGRAIDKDSRLGSKVFSPQKISGVEQDAMNKLRRGSIVYPADFASPINQ